MKKLFFTLIALVLSIGYCSATKVYADLSMTGKGTNGKGSGCTWDSENSTLSWTKGSDNWANLSGLPTGDITAFTSLNINITSLNSGPCRLLVFYKKSDGTETSFAIAFYNVGSKSLSFAERDEFTKHAEDLKNVTRYAIAGGSASGSLSVSSVCLVKPFSLEFDETGKATIYPSDLTVTGGTFNDETGLFTGDGENNVTISINLPASGVDMTALTGFKVNLASGTLPTNHCTIKSGSWTKEFYTSQAGSDALQTNGFPDNATAVTSWEWSGEDKTTASFTLTSITLQSNVITALEGHETLITKDMYSDAANCNLATNQSVGQGTVVYGKENSDAEGAVNPYADLAGYDKLIIRATPGKSFRMFVNDSKTQYKVLTTGNDSLTTLDKPNGDFHLYRIKTNWGSSDVVVYSITLYKNDVDAPCSYKLAGAGVSSASAKAALADAAATSYDATGLTGSGITLTVANPNAIILANSGAVSNSDNVVVSGTAASLALQAGYPFAAPQAFTATKASLKASVSAAGAATFIAPFEAAIPSGVKAYTLAANGNDITATEVTGTIPANNPVLLNAAEGTYDFTATNASVGTEATGAKDALTGVYAATTVAQGSYVLQNGTDGIGFYKVASDNIVLKPFQAYLTTTSSAAKLAIVFGQTTDIKSMHDSNFTTQNAGTVYNLAGQRVGKSYKGIVIVNGKKTIRK